MVTVYVISDTLRKTKESMGIVQYTTVENARKTYINQENTDYDSNY